MKKLTILYTSFENPYFPGGTGGQTRQYNLVKQLSSKHDFHYVGPRVEGDALSKLNGLFKRVTMPAKTIYNRLSSAAARLTPHGYPRYVQHFEGVRHLLQPLLRQATSLFSYDLIHVEHTNVSHWLHDQFQDIPKIIVAQNVKSRIWEQFYQQASGAKKKKLYRDYIRFVAYEQKYVPEYDGIVAVSTVDKEIIQNKYHITKPIYVVPNGVDTEYFNVSKEIVEPETIVFTGSMGYPPNNEAMLYFCRDIFPKILKLKPACRLFIVGSDPGREVKLLADNKNIFVTGFVNDTRPFIASASVVIAPLLSGSGTRLKILESMAMGKTIVSTSVGAEGIECTNGGNILIADDVQTFTDLVVDLFENPDKGINLGTNARKLAVEKYSWGTIATCLENAYESVLSFRANRR